MKEKRRVIRAERRKSSKTFPGYWKYELDIQEVDGSITKNIPAYGIDLQDALNRTVQQNRAITVESKFKKIPSSLLYLGWFTYFGCAGAIAVLQDAMWPVFGSVGILGAGVIIINQLTKYKKITD